MRGLLAGAVCSISSSALFALNAVVGKEVISRNVDPGILTWGRVSFGALLLWSGAGVAGVTIRVPGRNWPRAAMLGALFALQASLLFFALQRMPAATVEVILFTYPILVAVISALRRTRRIGWIGFSLIIIAIAGCWLVIGGPRGEIDLLGTALAVACAVSFASYVLGARKVMDALGTLSTTCMVLTMAAALMSTLLIGRTRADLGAAVPWAIVLGALLVLALLGLMAAVRYLGSVAAAVGSLAEPCLVFVLVTVALGQRMSAAQVLGGCLVIASATLFILRDVGLPSPLVPDG